jgi:hypothetical protein
MAEVPPKIRYVAEMVEIERMDDEVVVLRLDCIDQVTGEPTAMRTVDIPREQWDQIMNKGEH